MAEFNGSLTMLVVGLAQNEPGENEQKESSEELPHVETTSGQDSVHTIAVYSLQIVAFQAVIRLQMAKDRFDCCSSGIPSPDAGLDALLLFAGQVHHGVGNVFARSPVTAIAIGM